MISQIRVAGILTSLKMHRRKLLLTLIAILTCFGILVITSVNDTYFDFVPRKDDPKQDFTVVKDMKRIQAKFKKIISTMDYGTSNIGKILAKRRKQLMEYCDGKEFLKAGNSSEEDIMGNFIYDRNYKIVYCSIEKTGSTFWKSIFSILTSVTNVSDPYAVTNVHERTYNTIKKMNFEKLYATLQESMKMVVVRDPYARLFSAYLNKMFDINTYYWSYGTHAIKKFRKNPSSVSLKYGHDIKFEELVKYFIYTEHFATHRDPHFTTMTDHCRPCQMKYDVIIKMETFQRDNAYALSMLDTPDLKPILKKLSKKDNHGEMKIVENTIDFAFKNWKSLSKCISRSELIRRSWRSSQMRGYISKNIKYPLNKSEEMMFDRDKLVEVFQNAVNNSESKEIRSKNRQLAVEEAYSRVPMDDLIKLQKIFESDCLTFGYDCAPEYIFDKSRKPNTSFLDVWQA